MKKVISALFSFVFFIGCSSSSSHSDSIVDSAKMQKADSTSIADSAKIRRADTTNWVATYVVNSNTWGATTGPVKRVIFTDVTYHNDTAKNGVIRATPYWLTDTFYLLPTVDSSIFLKDVAGKPLLNPTTKKKIYSGSFRTPMGLQKQFVKPLISIPSRFKLN